MGDSHSMILQWEVKVRKKCFSAMSEFDQVIAMVCLSPRRRLSPSPCHSAAGCDLHALRQSDFIM